MFYSKRLKEIEDRLEKLEYVTGIKKKKRGRPRKVNK